MNVATVTESNLQQYKGVLSYPLHITLPVMYNVICNP